MVEDNWMINQDSTVNNILGVLGFWGFGVKAFGLRGLGSQDLGGSLGWRSVVTFQVQGFTSGASLR